MNAAKISVEGRHDPCICPRVVPVAESMVALTLLDHMTRQQLMQKTSKLHDLREAIDLIDFNTLLLLSERQNLVGQIGRLKKKKGEKMLDKRREQEILQKQLAAARELGLDKKFVREICTAIFHLAKSTQPRPDRED